VKGLEKTALLATVKSSPIEALSSLTGAKLKEKERLKGMRGKGGLFN